MANQEDYCFDFKDIVDSAKDVIIVTKADSIEPPGPEIVYVNHAFTELTGYTPEEAIGKNPRILQNQETDDETKATIRAALEHKQPCRVTIRNVAKNGCEYWLDLSILPLKDKDGEVTHFVAIERDFTDHKQQELALSRMSMVDPLTQLQNRRAFNESIAKEFANYQRELKPFAVLMVDADHFKQVNDTYGHQAGDRTLERLAVMLKIKSRPRDVCARIGGEEFCILLPDTDKQGAQEVAERIRYSIANADFSYEDHEFKLTISVGVSLVEETDTDVKEVMGRADTALYQAKENGRNRVLFV